jgi:2-aminoadipate transaminase
MSFEHLLADRTGNMGASAIREILKLLSQPGMISLAGGIPAPESFPLEIIKELTANVIKKYSSRAFQYDLTEGFLPLREALTGYLAGKGIQADASDLLVSSGSQGALDGLGKILISRGDYIAVEAPTYLGAIQAFNPYGPKYLRMDTDEDGLIPESLEEILNTYSVKFVYTVPTFQNPTGRTIPMERRRQIAQIAETHNILIIEDDPYSELRYRGEPIPAIKSLAPDHVVYLGTLSKVLAPGLRTGFVAAPSYIRDWMILAKQGVDLHTSTPCQALAAEYLSGGHFQKHLPYILDLYRPKQEAMFDALEQYFPPDLRWSKPDGGMFVWVEGPKHLDMEKIYVKSVARKAAFVPGKFFFTGENEGLETMRLNFTMSTPEQINTALKIIAEVVEESR